MTDNFRRYEELINLNGGLPKDNEHGNLQPRVLELSGGVSQALREEEDDWLLLSRRWRYTRRRGHQERHGIDGTTFG